MRLASLLIVGHPWRIARKPSSKSKSISLRSMISILILPSVVDISVNVGKVPSLNAFYAGKHWIVRQKAKNKFKSEILDQLNQYDPIKLKSVTIRAEVNYRYDVDNCIMVVKFAMDAFKEWGGIDDDNPKHFNKLQIVYNELLPKDSAKVFFIGEKKD